MRGTINITEVQRRIVELEGSDDLRKHRTARDLRGWLALLYGVEDGVEA